MVLGVTADFIYGVLIAQIPYVAFFIFVGVAYSRWKRRHLLSNPQAIQEILRQTLPTQPSREPTAKNVSETD